MRFSDYLSMAVLALGLAACGNASTAQGDLAAGGAAPTAASGTENTLVLELTTGTVKIKLRPDLAPEHVARVRQLAGEGFYNGIIFHRVIAGFMAQTGDPTGTGRGGMGELLPAEFSKAPHTRGAVSMARTDPPMESIWSMYSCAWRSIWLVRCSTK